MKGRVAVITGGASGIGLACARELATRSITVVIADRDLAGATRAAESMEGKAYAIDVGIASDLEPLADAIERAMGPVSMLINAAGIIQGDLLAPQELSYEQCERLFRINLLGTQAACAAFGSRGRLDPQHRLDRGHAFHAVARVRPLKGCRDPAH